MKTKIKSKILLVISVTLLISLIISACGPTATPTESVAEPQAEEEEVVEETEAETLKVAYIPCGKITDGGWSQSGWEAIQSVVDTYNLEVGYTEGPDVADASRIAGDYADQGYDIVLLHCGSFADAALEAAVGYPDVWFGAPNDGDVLPNVFRYDGRAQEPAFLAGALAGLTTETNTLGVISGFAFPALTRQVEGFRLGARYVNPDVKVMDIYINTWEDIAIGKEAASAMIDSGADIIFACTDQAAQGVFKAAEERGVYAIGNFGDQHDLSPTTMLTSVLPDWGSLLIQMIGVAAEGKLEAKLYESQEAPWGSLAPFYDLESTIPQAAKDAVAEITTKMGNGEIVLPGTTELGDPGVGDTIDPKSFEK